MTMCSRRPLRVGLLLACIALPACHGRDHAPLFRLLSARRTGIDFANEITPTEAHNFHNDIYIYNGAGVGIGDVNGDGLPDIFLVGNMVSSRLYLNRGNMRFEDVTAAAGVATHSWATGVAMVDIDGDGDLDMYVSVGGPPFSTPEQRRNLLFINQGVDRNGVPHFVEQAQKFGLAYTGFTTQAVFLDYDGDGDLDAFLLGNSPDEFSRGETGMAFGPHAADPAGFDKLFRNNGNGTFTDVSDQAGILRRLGYGLGVAVADFNGDGWPDIYVSNDSHPQDVLYINNGNGTFTDRAAAWLGHTVYAGMGIDVADFDNNGWPDILQVDMQPEELAERKRVSGSMSYRDLQNMTRPGFNPQYNQNALQLNQGVAADGRVLFSEIGRQAGIGYTSWSWSPLLADLDNDGWKDIFITAGYPKAVIDYDYQTQSFQARQIRDPQKAEQRVRELVAQAPQYRLPKRAFRNNGDLSFSDVSRQWGIDQLGISYGAAYADLENTGRLDLVVNNLNGRASIYENVGGAGAGHHYLEVRLDGEYPNRRGLGARLILTAGGRKQYLYQMPYRGYASSVDDRPHFGLGPAQRVDTLEVIWPDRRRQVLTGLRADQIITVHQREARPAAPADTAPARKAPRWFQPMPADKGLVHLDRAYGYLEDYTVQPLLPYQLSEQGPPVAVADVDGNGLDDVFIGGAAGFPGTLFLQQADGRFVPATDNEPWVADKAYEDWGALFFDANGDGRPDLYVASGGYQVAPGSGLLQDRLYINQGHGRFVRDSAALPAMEGAKAAVVACDFNGDGKPDLFVGGRLTPRDYPRPTRSYVLRNDGGHFTDVTRALAPELVQPGGMITDALCLDFNGDGRMDLVTAGDWMPIQFYANDGTHLRNVTATVGLPPMRGWWFRLAAGDVDHDGRPDLVAGNLGLNYSYTTSKESPFGLYAGNFSGHRSLDLIFTQQLQGTDYPYYGLAVLGNPIPSLMAHFNTFESFARASAPQIFGDQLRQALHYQVDTFASVWLHNEGNGRFTSHPLPALAQIAPIRGIVAQDVDGDGNLDLIVAGNLYDVEPNTPRADAGKGLWLKGDGRGGFTAVSPAQSGFLAPLDVRNLVLINTPGGKGLLVANNRDSLQAFTLAPPRPRSAAGPGAHAGRSAPRPQSGRR